MNALLADAPYLDPGRRHDFLLLFDATDSNPNGDPDAGNLPRIDPETNQGLVTDVALKRKVRNYVALYEQLLDEANPSKKRFKIYVEVGVALNERHRRAYTALGKEVSQPNNTREEAAGNAANAAPASKKRGNKTSTQKAADPEARAWMCDNFFDVRMFGAVMSTGDFNCGQVRGPVQLAIARSVDPVFQQELSITRVAVTREEELTNLQAGDGGKDREMGRKAIVPYGLYVAEGTYSPMLGMRNGRRSDGTGVNSDDLALFWEALNRMWDQDRSAARGRMACRGLHVFTHDHPLGNAPRYRLIERVDVSAKCAPARSFDDYAVEVNLDGLPEGVTYHDLTE